MNLRTVILLLSAVCFLQACASAPAELPSETPAPTEPVSQAMVQDIDDPVWVSGEIRGYFAALGDGEHGSDIAVTPSDGSGMPYVRMLRYTVSDIDLRQYLEETLIAHFEERFGDVVFSRGDIREIPDFGDQEAVMTDYELIYAGEHVFVTFASVRDGSDIISFCTVTDADHPLDAETLIRDNARGSSGTE